MSFTPEQVQALLQPIKPHRVLRDGKGMAHVAAFDVIAHLNRLFGFGGWRKEILSLDLVGERAGQNKNGRDAFWVTYRCVMRLTVVNPDGDVVFVTEDAATGSAQGMPSFADAHDFAVKNAVSYAVKRCAKDLGDQFGLSLYNKGQTDALVVKTLVGSDPVEGDLQDHAPEPLVMGNDERHDESEGDDVGSVGFVTAPQAKQIVAPLDAIEDQQARTAAKVAFKEFFGATPVELPADRFEEALKWVDEKVEAVS